MLARVARYEPLTVEPAAVEDGLKLSVGGPCGLYFHIGSHEIDAHFLVSVHVELTSKGRAEVRVNSSL